MTHMQSFQGFHAVEAMQEASEAAGWDIEYRQMEAGQLEAKTVFQELGGSSLICETATRRLEISARTPESAYTIMVPLPGSHIRVNGRRLSDDRLLVLAPGIDLFCNTNSGAEIWSVHLSASYLQDSAVDPGSGTVVLRDQVAVLEQWRHLIKLALGERGRSAMAHYDARFSDFAELLLSGELSQIECDPYHLRRKRIALDRAVEYLEGHMAQPIRMGQVCSYARVSRRTLERLFRQELQQSPYEYLRVRRLNAVRKAIRKQPAEDRTVADIASENGFVHMGRFSSVYRGHFGRLPSEDLLR
jgi:AraC family ethanolamine operon transcriptional activator